MMQLDLFDYSPPSETIIEPAVVGAPAGGATIIPFPQDRNLGRVRRVAVKLSERDGKLRESYWTRSCNDLASMLVKAGHSEQQIATQLSAYYSAVCLELHRLHHAGLRQPGGAA